jgi:hypothetical protein
MAAAVRSDADSYALARRREADEEAERRLKKATEEAHALLAERVSRISELSDRILERGEALIGRLEEAGELRGQLEGLTRALGEAAEQMTHELTHPRPVAPPTELQPPSGPAQDEGEDELEEHPMADSVRPLRPPGERAEERRPLRSITPAHVPRDEADARLDDARLVALQMAVAGRSREEVGAHLRSAFEVGDPEPILDHVFAQGFPPNPPAV